MGGAWAAHNETVLGTLPYDVSQSGITSKTCCVPSPPDGRSAHQQTTATCRHRRCTADLNCARLRRDDAYAPRAK
eukprot:15448803-Alexandrium_andersonii.AAC.1